jgi:radical SAM protein with 4Fe4S-binding SPASM domain
MTELMKKENDQLVRNFLNRTFFEAWKPENKDKREYGNYKALELQVNGFCDLKCSYCYYSKFQDQLYPSNIAGKSNILKNLDIMLAWLKKNQLEPEIELFSGELFFQEVGFNVLERVVEWQLENNIENNILIPTNFSFIFDEEKIERLEALIEKSKRTVVLSCSVDGKYSDANRPFIDGRVRDDTYYNRMFEFCKKWGFGFHPMIYSDNVEHWQKNWLWWQEKMEEYEIPMGSIYLLEVRNKEWNRDQIKEFYKFTRFLVNWTWNKVKDFVSPEKFPLYVFEQKTFNMFNMFSTMSRGVGCSVQSALQLRLGDLTTSVCHRAAYKAHNLWKFVTENDEIVDIEAINYNLYIAVAAMDTKNSPFCNYCSIRELCSGQCLGAMHETNGDPFMPIPTVCALEHAKTAGMLDELKALDLHTHFYNWSVPKQKSIKLYYEYLKEKV